MARLPRPSGRLLGFIAGTLLVAYGAATSAAVNVFHTKLPAVALSIDSDDPVALVRNAQIDLAAGDMPAGGNDAILGIVRRSVSDQPINAPAFRLYGLASATNADLPGVREQMAVSERMERRDAAAQLWLIEDAVQRNDVAAALRHYDTALRIEQSTRAVLYPVLTDALESETIRERFVPYMQAPPPWLESFLRFAVSNTRDPVAVADLARLSGGFPDGAAYSSLDRELLTQLVASEDYEAAIAHYARIGAADQSVPRTLALTGESTSEAYSPITWQQFSIEGIEPFVLASPAGEGRVEIEAEMEAGYSGPVARKLIALKPGRYAFTANLRSDDFGTQDRGSWRIVCPASTGAAPLVDAEFDFEETIEIGAGFTVPAGCPVQLVLVSAATMVRSGYVTLVLAEARLVPAS
ncbi:hypothetical protein [Erythrobacter sp. JK5]|uniref:hypothetical protein n=1 Tax=Erythrobacter sp. JK5 TaxID=2829500 RepID=UPI001BA6C153|nr:hypothetical protein [Erythrobacter sp. JK5]QUL37317.1 hypothetical protein KDC96_13245 [Erythrobacter sp. JK5]